MHINFDLKSTSKNKRMKAQIRVENRHTQNAYTKTTFGVPIGGGGGGGRDSCTPFFWPPPEIVYSIPVLGVGVHELLQVTSDNIPFDSQEEEKKHIKKRGKQSLRSNPCPNSTQICPNVIIHWQYYFWRGGGVGPQWHPPPPPVSLYVYNWG